MRIRSLLFALILPAAACYTKPVPHPTRPAEPATPVARETTPAPAPELAIDETCPMAVPGTTVSVEDNVDGATLVFTTTGDVTALRSRVISLANDHNSEHLKMGALPVGTQRTYASGGATYQGAGSGSGSGIASQQEGNESYPNANATGAGVASGSGSASSTTIGDENDNGAGSGSGSSIASGEGNGSGSGSGSSIASEGNGSGSGSGSGIASGVGQGSSTTVAGNGMGSGTSTGSAVADHDNDETGVEGNQGPGQLPTENQGTYASGGAYGQSGSASNGEAQGMTGKALILTHSRAQIEPFDGGVRLVFIADPQNVQALRDEVRLHAEHMKTGRCD